MNQLFHSQNKPVRQKLQSRWNTAVRKLSEQSADSLRNFGSERSHSWIKKIGKEIRVITAPNYDTGSISCKYTCVASKQWGLKFKNLELNKTD